MLYVNYILFVYLQLPPFDNITQTVFEMSRVECKLGNITVTGFAPYPLTSLLIEGLLEETTYAVHVAVNNSAGLGDYSYPVVIVDTAVAAGM